MKRSHKPPNGALPVGVPPPVKMKLSPVKRTYKDITIELLTEQKEPCQDSGCGIRAAFRVTWPDRGTLVTLLLCAHHSQVTVAEFRQRLLAEAAAHPPLAVAPSPLPAPETTPMREANRRPRKSKRRRPIESRRKPGKAPRKRRGPGSPAGTRARRVRT